MAVLRAWYKRDDYKMVQAPSLAALSLGENVPTTTSTRLTHRDKLFLRLHISIFLIDRASCTIRQKVVTNHWRAEPCVPLSFLGAEKDTVLSPVLKEDFYM